MPLYLVSYDIAEQHGDEYKPLWTYLDALGSLKSCIPNTQFRFHGRSLN